MLSSSLSVGPVRGQRRWTWLSGWVWALVVLGAGWAWPDQTQRVGALLLAPLLEELVFRLGVQQALLDRGWRVGWTCTATALVFAAAHLPRLGWGWPALATALPAWGLGWVYVGWGWWPCVALHALFNLIGGLLWLGWAG